MCSFQTQLRHSDQFPTTATCKDPGHRNIIIICATEYYKQINVDFAGASLFLFSSSSSPLSLPFLSHAWATRWAVLLNPSNLLAPATTPGTCPGDVSSDRPGSDKRPPLRRSSAWSMAWLRARVVASFPSMPILKPDDYDPRRPNDRPTRRRRPPYDEDDRPTRPSDDDEVMTTPSLPCASPLFAFTRSASSLPSVSPFARALKEHTALASRHPFSLSWATHWAVRPRLGTKQDFFA